LKGKNLKDEGFAFHQISRAAEEEMKNKVNNENNAREKRIQSSSNNLVLFSRELNQEIDSLIENLKQSNQTLNSLNEPKKDRLEYLLYFNILLSIVSIILTFRRK
jgi:hypothetical protein